MGQFHKRLFTWLLQGKAFNWSALVFQCALMPPLNFVLSAHNFIIVHWQFENRKVFSKRCKTDFDSRVVPPKKTFPSVSPGVDKNPDSREEKREMYKYLQFRRPTLIPDEQQVAVSVDYNLLFEPPALRTLLLHVGPREVSVDQRRLPRGQGSHDAESDVGNAPTQRPLLAVDERICKGKDRKKIEN